MQQLHRELPLIVRHLLRDREGFQGFVDETEQMLARLNVSTDGAEWRRLLHTLKGNAAVYGFELFATHCHELEDLFEVEGGDAASARVAAGVEALARDWNVMLGSFSVFLGGEAQAFDPARGERARRVPAAARVARGPRRAACAWRAAGATRRSRTRWRSTRARSASWARASARRSSRASSTTACGCRAPRCARSWACWCTWCATRSTTASSRRPSACAPASRAPARSPSRAASRGPSSSSPSTTTAAASTGRRSARAPCGAALPATTERDLIEALFTDGISTRDVVSDLSGRGVGLSAVQQVCQQLGGTIHVDSRPGQGTRFEFRFVLATLVEAPRAESRRARGLATAHRAALVAFRCSDKMPAQCCLRSVRGRLSIGLLAVLWRCLVRRARRTRSASSPSPARRTAATSTQRRR